MAARIRPDLIITNYNLPGGMDGLEVAAKLREILRFQVPVIILTGDISTDALRSIAILPLIMLAAYIGLLLYFRRKGGYKPVVLELKQ